MKRNLIVLTLIAATLASVMAPSLAGQASAANRTQSHPAFLDKTRFVLHMGAAYFAFHHFVYKRFRDGAFKKGARHRTLNIIKAGVALLFAFHEVKEAYKIAQKSKSKTLHLLVSPLNALGAAMQSIGNKFHKGSYSDSDVTGLNSQANTFQSTADKDGYGFHDRSVPVPGAS